jgi:hypothetical protein
LFGCKFFLAVSNIAFSSHELVTLFLLIGTGYCQKHAAYKAYKVKKESIESIYKIREIKLKVFLVRGSIAVTPILGSQFTLMKESS